VTNVIVFWIIKPHRRCGLLLQMDQGGLSVSQSVGHDFEPWKNGSTDRGAVCNVDSCGPKERCIR